MTLGGKLATCRYSGLWTALIFLIGLATQPASAQNAANTGTVTAPAGVTDNIPGNNSATDDDPVLRSITLGKTWVNAVAGNAVTLTITGATNAVAGNSTAPTTTTNATAVAGAGAVITLTETFTGGNAAGYVTTLACMRSVGGGDVPVSGTGPSRTITMPADGGVNCTYTNTRAIVTLTLLKTVINDNGGTALDTAWTLNATGPSTISGTEGQAAITNAVVPAGTYTLTETGGPAGYTAGTWVCTAGTLVGNSLTLTNDQTATCTITNDDTPAPALGIDKAPPVLTIDADGSGTITPGDTLTYTITATNTGNATLTNVMVSDNKITPTGGTTPCATVPVGATCSLIGTYVVTAAE